MASEIDKFEGFSIYARRPFTVEALEFTKENLEDFCPALGEMDAKADGTPFIRANPDVVQTVTRIFPGFWLTRMGPHIRVWNRRIFRDQFVEADESVLDLVSDLNTRNRR